MENKQKQKPIILCPTCKTSRVSLQEAERCCEGVIMQTLREGVSKGYMSPKGLYSVRRISNGVTIQDVIFKALCSWCDVAGLDFVRDIRAAEDNQYEQLNWASECVVEVEGLYGTSGFESVTYRAYPTHYSLSVEIQEGR